MGMNSRAEKQSVHGVWWRGPTKSAVSIRKQNGGRGIHDLSWCQWKVMQPCCEQFAEKWEEKHRARQMFWFLKAYLQKKKETP